MIDVTNGITYCLLSGGVGQRSEHFEPKQFYELSGHPMIAYSLIPAVREPRITEILVNAPPGYEERTTEILHAYCATKPFRVLRAGKTRQESSEILADAATYETLVLHEAARPMVDLAMLRTLLDCPDDNAGYYYPIAFSMCRIDPETGLVKKGVSREKVFDIQLPQKFRKDVILRAHARARRKEKVYHEDSVMVVKEGKAAFRALMGKSANVKITTPEDFVIAKHILDNRLK